MCGAMSSLLATKMTMSNADCTGYTTQFTAYGGMTTLNDTNLMNSLNPVPVSITTSCNGAYSSSQSTPYAGASSMELADSVTTSFNAFGCAYANTMLSCTNAGSAASSAAAFATLSQAGVIGICFGVIIIAGLCAGASFFAGQTMGANRGGGSMAKKGT